MNLAQLSLEAYWEACAHYWRALLTLQRVPGHLHDPVEQFPETVEGLQLYLTAGGVRYFNAFELVTPHHRDLAHVLGYDVFLLPRQMWPMTLGMALCADALRSEARGPVKARNTWRPRKYNCKVTSAIHSDHVWGCGWDLDFASWTARRRASRVVQAWWDSGLLQVSVGTGRRTIHLGLFAPQTLKIGKQRRWTYGNPDAAP